jgi:hypothetical protein
MFAVIYKCSIKKGAEKQFVQAWKIIAEDFIKHREALGSSLHKTEDGFWVAYSRWPNRAMRDKWWGDNKETLPKEIMRAIEQLKECQEEKHPEICMEVVEDLLIECK